MSPVIGQRIVLSEKWPDIFVVAERGNDFETRPRGNGMGKEVVREERGSRLFPGASPLDARERAHTRARVPTCFASALPLAMQHTCRPVYARSCSL